MDVRECPPRWQSPDPWSLADEIVCMVDYRLGYTWFQDRGGDLGAGDSPSRVLVNETDVRELMELCARDTCIWQGGAWARQSVVDVEWNLAVSVFYGPVPEGY